MEGQPQNNQGHKQASQSSEQIQLQGLSSRPNINKNQEETKQMQESPIPPPSQNTQNGNQAILNQSCHPLLGRPVPGQQIDKKQKTHVASNSYEGSFEELTSKQNKKKSDNKEKDCWEKFCGLFLNCFSSREQKSLSLQEKEQEKVSEAIRRLKQQQYQYVQKHQEECLTDCRRIIEKAQEKNTSIILDRAAEYFYQVAKYYYYSEQYYEAQQLMNKLIAKAEMIQKANFSQINLKLFQLLIDCRQRVQQFRLKQPEIIDLRQQVKNKSKKIAENLETLSQLLEPKTFIPQVQTFEQKFKLKAFVDKMIENQQDRQKIKQLLKKLKQIKKLNQIKCGQLLSTLISDTIECASAILKSQPILQMLSEKMDGYIDEIKLSFQQFIQDKSLSDNRHQEQILHFSRLLLYQFQIQTAPFPYLLNQVPKIVHQQSSPEKLSKKKIEDGTELNRNKNLTQNLSQLNMRRAQNNPQSSQKQLSPQLLVIEITSKEKTLTYSSKIVRSIQQLRLNQKQHQKQFESKALTINDIIAQKVQQECSTLCFEEESFHKFKDSKDMKDEQFKSNPTFFNLNAVYIEADSSKNWLGIYRNAKIIRCTLNQQNTKIIKFCQGILIKIKQYPQIIQKEPPKYTMNEPQNKGQTNQMPLQSKVAINAHQQSINSLAINEETKAKQLNNLQVPSRKIAIDLQQQKISQTISKGKHNESLDANVANNKLSSQKGQNLKQKYKNQHQSPAYKPDKDQSKEQLKAPINISTIHFEVQPEILEQYSEEKIKQKEKQTKPSPKVRIEAFKRRQQQHKEKSSNSPQQLNYQHYLNRPQLYNRQQQSNHGNQVPNIKRSSKQSSIKPPIPGYPNRSITYQQRKQASPESDHIQPYLLSITGFKNVHQSHIKGQSKTSAINHYHQNQNKGRRTQEQLNRKTSQNQIKRSPNLIDNHQRSRGLENIGNTCYMNSVLQCLHKSKPFNQIFKEVVQQHEYQKKQLPSLSANYNQLLDQLNKNKQYPYNPKQIKRIVAQSNFLFQGYGQNDAVQFLSTFLEQLGQELNISDKKKLTIQLNQKWSDQEIYRLQKQKDQSKNDSPVEKCFVGRYRTIYTCQVCKGKYRLFQKFKVHYVPIPEPEPSSLSWKGYQQKKSYTLTQCLQDFEKQDLMTGDNAFPCDQCGKDTNTKKGMAIYESNTILVIGLKRFHDNVKNQRIIDIPMKLNSKQFQYRKEGKANNRVYKLYAALIHRGSIHGGHYTTVCSDFSSSNYNQWKLYNDTYVSEIDESRLKRELQDAYALFYELISE